MNLQQLEYIIAVDRHRHFARAAEACNVTQPTLSMMIQKLEDELGIKIFDRSRQPVTPTPAGELLLAQARRALHEVARIGDLVRQQKTTLGGDLRLGIIPTLAPYLLPRFVHAFLEKYPGIRLVISEHFTTNLIEELKKGHLDAGILVSPVHEAAIREQPLFYEPLYVFSSHGYPKTYLLPEDLDPNELLLLEEGHCLRSQIMNLCELKRHADNRLQYEAGSLETLIRLVGTGRCVTVLPALAVETLSAAERERVFPFQAPTPVREVSLVTHRNYLKSDLIAALYTAILDNTPEAFRQPDSVRRIEIQQSKPQRFQIADAAAVDGF